MKAKIILTIIGCAMFFLFIISIAEGNIKREIHSHKECIKEIDSLKVEIDFRDEMIHNFSKNN